MTIILCLADAKMRYRNKPATIASSPILDPVRAAPASIGTINDSNSTFLKPVLEEAVSQRKGKPMSM